MGLQDELQAEVDRIRAGEAAENAREQRQQACYREHLRPVMLRAESYFSELIAKLKVIEPDIRVHYPLDPFQPEGVALRQSGYRLRTDGSVNPTRIDILCSCDMERPQEFSVPNNLMAETRSKLLNSYNFPHHRKNRLDSFYQVCGATFTLEGPLIARIRIIADASDAAAGCIAVELRNFFDDPEPRHHRFEAAACDDAWLERLAQLLLRKVSHLVETPVSETLRDQLQEQLRAEQRQRERDLARAEQELAAQRQRALAARPANRARHALRRAATRAGGAGGRLLRRLRRPTGRH